MSRLTVGENAAEVTEGKRLVRAIEDDLSVDIMHACGGNARCTTCRVTFDEGEPDRMTVAEKERLEEAELMGDYRLSCQIQVTHDMAVTPTMLLSTSDSDYPGDTPADEITPPPEWIDAQ